VRKIDEQPWGHSVSVIIAGWVAQDKLVQGLSLGAVK